MMTGVALGSMSISGTMEVFSFENDLSIFENIMTKFASQVAGRMESRS